MEEQGQNKLMQIYKILDRRHIHDEELWINRVANFLLVNSFLVIAFATFVIYNKEKFFWFSFALPCIGISMCIVFFLLFLIQPATTNLWFKMQNEIEEMGVFPESKKGNSLAPNKRHEERIGKTWMQPIWRRGPLFLIAIICAMWGAFLWLLFS